MLDRTWVTKASCLGVDSDVFFDDVWPTVPGDETDGELVPGALARAKAVCAGCPVRIPCHETAMAEEAGASIKNRYGVRGGITGAQRYSIWRRDNMRCEQCGETFDPLGLVAGEAVCSCGSGTEVPIQDTGDRWYPRHDDLLRKLIDYLLRETKPGDRVLPPYQMLRALGHRRKDDMPLLYARLLDDGMLEQGPGRGEWYRAAGNKAMAKWVPFPRGNRRRQR